MFAITKYLPSLLLVVGFREWESNESEYFPVAGQFLSLSEPVIKRIHIKILFWFLNYNSQKIAINCIFPFLSFAFINSVALSCFAQEFNNSRIIYYENFNNKAWLTSMCLNYCAYGIINNCYWLLDSVRTIIIFAKCP